ncbi:7TM diverse intracellular signaling domain-containing protein [Maribellus comscasis]|uniref:7TM diverse intracellular signaling domain-containing protein n=1 Tax=Maribellus comscasis TaxID=2681766 RepID=UPI00131C9DE3|nr:7TM diverse intracellular signaling domain-containing protein [Maribellus comscasis]
MFTIILLAVLLPAKLFSKEKKELRQELPEIISKLQFYKGHEDLSVDSVHNLPENLFKEFTSYTISEKEVFWLKIVIDNQQAATDEYFIHFNSHLDDIYLYQKNDNGVWIEERSGVLIPEKLKTVKGFIKDKIPFTISNGSSTILYLKIENQIEKYLDTKKIWIVDSKSFNRIFIQTKQIQSIFLGIVVILCFFNLLLFLSTGTRIYLYYMLYAIFSSIYFIYAFQYFETGYFANHPHVSLYLFFSATFIPVVYCWFLYELLKTDVNDFVRSIVKKYAITVSAFALLILIIALFDYTTGVLVDDIYSIVNSIIVVLLVVLLFRKVSNTVKIVLSGSVFLVAGVFSTIVLNFQNETPGHGYFFQSGFFIELIFFTVAINFTYQNERLEKLKFELKNASLENEKLAKEREAQKLREQINLKERDLATKVFAISQKEMLIKNVTSHLEKQVQNNSVKVKDIKEVISNLSSKMNDNHWEEFETHFIQVHPDFYRLLNKKYPGLTRTERKLCAFIKLNLTTKEIAGITKRNPESIHMTRCRLRRKMGLNKSENLDNVINNIK